ERKTAPAAPSTGRTSRPKRAHSAKKPSRGQHGNIDEHIPNQSIVDQNDCRQTAPRGRTSLHNASILGFKSNNPFISRVASGGKRTQRIFRFLQFLFHLLEPPSFFFLRKEKAHESGFLFCYKNLHLCTIIAQTHQKNKLLSSQFSTDSHSQLTLHWKRQTPRSQTSELIKYFTKGLSVDHTQTPSSLFLLSYTLNIKRTFFSPSSVTGTCGGCQTAQIAHYATRYPTHDTSVTFFSPTKIFGCHFISCCFISLFSCCCWRHRFRLRKYARIIVQQPQRVDSRRRGHHRVRHANWI
ncbi:Hypothetical protein, putative, partial [Bodo saltans]